MHRRKFIGTAGAGAFALVSGVAPSASPASQFNDAVTFVTDRGLIDVSGDGFRPDAGVSRAVVVTALYRMAGKPEVEYESVFTDVPNGQWYSNAVVWADKTGLIGEFTGGDKFSPNETVNREQLTTMIFKFADIKQPETSDLAVYTDVGLISPWALTAMGWGISRGVISGASASTLEPGGAITRAQCAASLQRFVNLREDPRNIWVLNPVTSRTPVEAVPLAPRVRGGWEGKTVAVLANYNPETATIAAELEKLLPASANLVWIGDMTVIAGQTVNQSKPPSDKWNIMSYAREFQPAIREGKWKPDAIISGTGF